MMPLNLKLRKFTGVYKLSKSQKKINHRMYMDGVKLFAQNEKDSGTLIHVVRIYSQDIGMEFSREKCTMLIMKRGKRYMTDKMELSYQEKIKTLEEKKPSNTCGY